MKSAALFVSVVMVGLFSAAAMAGGEIGEISHEELVKAIKDKAVVLIDCNGSESYKAGHIPGAIDYQAVANDLASKLPQDKGALLVAYCGGPKCNAYQTGAKAALALGYTNVKHYKDGISGWKSSGAEVEQAK